MLSLAGYFGDFGGIGFKSGRQSRAAKIQPFVYLSVSQYFFG